MICSSNLITACCKANLWFSFVAFDVWVKQRNDNLLSFMNQLMFFSLLSFFIFSFLQVVVILWFCRFCWKFLEENATLEEANNYLFLITSKKLYKSLRKRFETRFCAFFLVVVKLLFLLWIIVYSMGVWFKAFKSCLRLCRESDKATRIIVENVAGQVIKKVSKPILNCKYF